MKGQWCEFFPEIEIKCVEDHCGRCAKGHQDDEPEQDRNFGEGKL